MKESIYRRCGCRDPESRKQLGAKCPQLATRRHGAYAIRMELPQRKDGTRRSFARSGYAAQDDAAADRDRVRALLGIPDEEDVEGVERVADLLEEVAKTKAKLPDYDETKKRFRTGQVLASRMTVGEWLDKWLQGKRRRTGTIKSYESHIRVHLRPHLGHLRIDQLSRAPISDMFAAIDERNQEILEANALRHEAVARLKVTRRHADRRVIQAELAAMPAFRRTTGTATQHRIRATLRAALNGAIREQLITFNVAKWVELDPVDRPRPMVWTEERVAAWRDAGERPGPVMVWTPAQTGVYLDHVADDRLYAMWHLICFRGLRRGEACGVRDADLNEKQKKLAIAEQLVQMGAVTELNAPKSRAGAREIDLDGQTLKVLRAHRVRKAAERLKWGEGWVSSGRIFTREDGSMLYPEWVSEMHVRNAAGADLPPVRLHDLRHGAASLMRAAGVDIKVIQETIGHSTSAFTRDTYVHLYPEDLQEAAEATVKIVPRVRKV